MSEQSLIFGVFENPEQPAAVVAGLRTSGLKHDQVNFVGAKLPEVRTVAVRLTNPEHKFAIIFASIGAVGGAIAGAYMAPSVPHLFSFQILTTMMASVSSAVVLGYFAGIIGAVLHSHQPQIHANIYEAIISKGKVIVSAEVDTAASRKAAFEVMDAHDALEITFQRAEPGAAFDVEPLVETFAERQIIDLSIAA